MPTLRRRSLHAYADLTEMITRLHHCPVSVMEPCPRRIAICLHARARREPAVPLLDLGYQHIAHHDLWHPAGEFHDVVAHPVDRLLVRHQRFIRAVEHADGDERIWPAIE